MKHKGIANIMLIALSTLIGLFVLEIGMQLAGLDYARVWEPDAELGWRHVPHAKRLWTEEGKGLIEINSLGQRDLERMLVKSPDTFRIAVFGDSMTEAVQVNMEDTFTYLLEERLKRLGGKIEVLNFGVNGYSSIQELLLFKREGPRYHPDLIVLATYLDNDVSGAHPDMNVSQGGVPFFSPGGKDIGYDFTRSRQSSESYNQEPIYSIRYYSSIYRFLSAWWWQLKAGEGQVPVDYIPSRYYLYAQPIAPKWEEAWELYGRSLLEFSREANRQNADFFVLSVPAPWVASTRAWDLILDSFPAMKKMMWNLEGPEKRLAQFCKHHGISLLAPYPAYGREWSSDPLYWGNLGHMTPRGHQVMARVLEEYLIKEQLIPPL